MAKQTLIDTLVVGAGDAVAHLYELAVDLCDVIAERDLNSVMVCRESGEVRVVDALFVAGRI